VGGCVRCSFSKISRQRTGREQECGVRLRGQTTRRQRSRLQPNKRKGFRPSSLSVGGWLAVVIRQLEQDGTYSPSRELVCFFVVECNTMGKMVSFQYFSEPREEADASQLAWQLALPRERRPTIHETSDGEWKKSTDRKCKNRWCCGRKVDVAKAPVGSVSRQLDVSERTRSYGPKYVSASQTILVKMVPPKPRRRELHQGK
jgi:hypothetical protein